MGVQCYIFAPYYTSHQLNIQTLIFDLGGVIMELHEEAIVQHFVRLSGHTPERVIQNYHTHPAFQQHEKGLISNDDFRAAMREMMEADITDEQIDTAWNSILGNITSERLDHLLKLKEKYQILILSNTNGIHEKRFSEILRESSGGKSLHNYANKVYYSHEIHMRKPDLEIYEYVISDAAINPSTSLFFDDKEENLDGAQSVGIQTKLITNPNQILDID